MLLSVKGAFKDGIHLCIDQFVLCHRCKRVQPTRHSRVLYCCLYRLDAIINQEYPKLSLGVVIVIHSAVARTLAFHQCGTGMIPSPGVMWAEFVVGSPPCSKVFLQVLRFSSLHKKQHFQISIPPAFKVHLIIITQKMHCISSKLLLSVHCLILICPLYFYYDYQ